VKRQVRCVNCRTTEGLFPVTVDGHVNGSLRPVKNTAHWCRPCWDEWNRRCREEQQRSREYTERKIREAQAAELTR
jgi:hypothetical protein